MTPAWSCWHADMLRWVHSTHLTHCDCASFGGSGCFQETPFPGGYVSESQQPGVRLVEMDAPAPIHTHSHIGCCSVHVRFVAKSFAPAQEVYSPGHDVQGSLLAQTNVYRVGWVPADYYFYLRALGDTESTLVLLPASYVNALFKVGNFSIVQFRFIYTCKGQINSIYSISTGHHCFSLPGPERRNQRKSVNEMFSFSFETKHGLTCNTPDHPVK